MISSRKGIIFLLVFLVLSLLRFSYLDQDAPPYQTANICQEDEPYYCTGAINKLCAYQNRTLKGFERTKSEKFDLYNRTPFFVSFLLFGNNYWGLRIPAVIASLLIALLLYSVFNVISPGNNLRNVFLLVVFTNFYFLTFSRYNNPQIFSALSITFTLWILIKHGYEKPWALLSLGFFAAFSVFWVYLMNAFLLGGISLFILIKTIQKKQVSILLYYGVGVILSIALFELCLKSIGCSITDIFSVAKDYGGDKGNSIITDSSSIKSILNNVKGSFVSIVTTGFFRYQLVLLGLFLVSIPGIIHIAKNNGPKQDIALLLLIVILMQVGQNYFAITYPFKKMLVVFPIVIITTYLAFANIELYGSLQKKRVLLVVWALVSLLLCLLNFKINKSPAYWGYRGTGCYETTPLWFDILNIATCLLPVILFIVVLLLQKANTLQYIKIGLVLSIAVNCVFGFKTFYLERKYLVRDCLTSLAPTLQNKVVIAGFPYTWQLYTNCIPAMHGYNINYGVPSTKLSADSMLVHKKADFVMEKVMQDTTSLYAKDTNVILYKLFKLSCYDYYVYQNKH